MTNAEEIRFNVKKNLNQITIIRLLLIWSEQINKKRWYFKHSINKKQHWFTRTTNKLSFFRTWLFFFFWFGAQIKRPTSVIEHNQQSSSIKEQQLWIGFVCNQIHPQSAQKKKQSILHAFPPHQWKKELSAPVDFDYDTEP